MLGIRYWSVHLIHNLSCRGYFRTRIFCKEGKDRWIVEICVSGLSQYYIFNNLFWSRTEWRGARPCRSIIPLWHTLVLYGAEVYDTSGNERTRADCRFSQRILEFAPNYLRSELDRRPPLTTTRSNSQSPPPQIWIEHRDKIKFWTMID